MVPNLDSFWQDSPHAIRDLMAENAKGPQPAQCIPVTADVTSLYSNIPLKEGIIFNGQHFLQLIGTAMGTRVAPTFACIFMGWLETLILATWMGSQPHLWKRYIDDGFFLWYGTEEELLKFIEHCNSSHETIKFTFEYNFQTRSVDFLDIHIWIDHDGWIQTDLFQKAGKKCQLDIVAAQSPTA